MVEACAMRILTCSQLSSGLRAYFYASAINGGASNIISTNVHLKARSVHATLYSTTTSQKYAILGAGFAGLSVAWQLLQLSTESLQISVDVFDEQGIGAGASGVSGGLLHPYTPKGKLVWSGVEGWTAALELLSVADAAADNDLSEATGTQLQAKPIAWKRGILRPPASQKHCLDFLKFVKLSSGEHKNLAGLECIHGTVANALLPGLAISPDDFALHISEGLNIDPLRYLQALWRACELYAERSCIGGRLCSSVVLKKIHLNSLACLAGLGVVKRSSTPWLCSSCSLMRQSSTIAATVAVVYGVRPHPGWCLSCALSDARKAHSSSPHDYDAVVVCLGAGVSKLEELSGKLPITYCRGVVTRLVLPRGKEEEFKFEGPSILGETWIAAQGSHNLVLGATKEWDNCDTSAAMESEAATAACDELTVKAAAFYPPIKKWLLQEARAGVRAMTPRTPFGKLPLIGCIDELVRDGPCRKFASPYYWILGGLGSRGLIYHAWLGKKVAEAVVSRSEACLPKEFLQWKTERKK